MNAENDSLLTALLRYTTPVALLGIALTLGFLAWLLSL
ncbi:MAG: hypothetical protein JW384_00537 [Nitrosomonadaceae bacterium]|jgi:hypothetical protein|nr:hypothetical protein [Nitrosomonadaceae bacterium]